VVKKNDEMEKKMKLVKLLLGTMILAGIMGGCGDVTMEPTYESYESRIVIEGYLQAGKNVDRIYITRNFPVNADLSKLSLIPDPEKTTVQLTDMVSNHIYELDFIEGDNEDINNFYWKYNGSDFVVQYGKTYQLDVWAVIENKSLYASSITTVPEKGFEIVSLNQTSLKYRERDLEGALKYFEAQINRSNGSSFYTAAVQALNPTLESFIYDNPYEDIKPEDVNLIDDALNYAVIHHAPESMGTSEISFGWEVFRVYDQYRIIIYAGDENYKDYLMTHNNVMEMNGNFHEPKFNIDGDGIGVFGSIIADTVYVEVTN
jgi:hypothetical protein